MLKLDLSIFKVISAFEGLDGGDFELRGWVGQLGWIGAVKIRIRAGNQVRVTQLL
jgi:hypothetical protein